MPENDKKPSDWAKEKQEEALNNNDEETALMYYELAKVWLDRGM